MKVFHAFTRVGWHPAVLALVLAGAFSATASATVRDLTLNDTAQLSPGMLHATLTGSVTCDPGDFSPYYGAVSGQLTQSKGASGFGSASPTCDGTPQPLSIDVSSNGFFGGSGAFKPGKAHAQLSTSTCDPYTWICSQHYTDAVIRLMK